jgi:N-acetylglucosamine kinase-like BadF-type ATPase
MNLYIGISGGHQTSTAVAIRDDAVAGWATGEGINLHTVQQVKLASRLGALLENLAERVGVSAAQLRDVTTKLVLAVPGAEVSYGQQLAEMCLFTNGWRDRSKFFIADDTWAGLIGGGLSRHGICAFAGTGAAVYVGMGRFAAGKHHKIDGWGHVLGDYGSGYQLALKMFRFLGRALDRGEQPPLFNDILAEDPRISDLDNVQHWFDQLYVLHPEDWRIRFARMGKVATLAANRAENPDADARRLVVESAEEMAESVDLAISRFLPESRELPVILQGGMFEFNHLFRLTVRRILKRRHSNEVRMAVFRPVVGAGLMACAEDSMLPDERVQRNITDSIMKLQPHERNVLAFPSISDENGRG